MFYSALPNFYMGLAFSGNCGRTFFFSFSPSTTETETDDELKNWKNRAETEWRRHAEFVQRNTFIQIYISLRLQMMPNLFTYD